MVNCNFFEIKLDNRCWEWSDLDSWISNIGFHCQFLKQNSKSKNQRTHPPKKNINKLIYTFFHIKKTHKYVQILYPTDLGLGVEHRLARKSQDVHLKQPGHLLLNHAGTFGWSGVIGGLVLERLQMATFFATATDDFFSMGFVFPAAFHRAAVLKHLICFFRRLGSAWIPREWKPERQSAATRFCASFTATTLSFVSSTKKASMHSCGARWPKKKRSTNQTSWTNR